MYWNMSSEYHVITIEPVALLSLSLSLSCSLAAELWVIVKAMSYFHAFIKRRQKQVLLDRFLVQSAWKENGSTEPIDSRDSISNSESCPT